MKLELQKGSRSKVLASLLFLMMSIFVVRLFYLQIVQHDYYVEIAKSEQVKRLTIPAKRGLIYAFDGDKPVPLVMNQTVYTVFVDPQTASDSEKIISTIRRIAGGNAMPDLGALINRKNSRYQILATKVSRVQADKIKAEKLKGLGFQEESQRVYPEGALAAQILGFVDYSGVGRYGIEAGLQDRLEGKDGLLQSVTDVSSIPLTIGNNNINIPAKNGDNIVLSVDRNIQYKVEQALRSGLKSSGATRGSVILMNPQNGQVLAMANSPSYRPDKLNNVKNVGVFNNNVVSLPYEPGSDIKTLTLAVGIEKGAITPKSTYVNTDSIQVDDRVIRNATYGHTGKISFQTALDWSLNTGFVTIAQRLGDGKSITRSARDIMYDYFYNKFRLGQMTGIEVANEAVGTVISPSNPDGNAVRYSNMAFGQGMDVTMVQVASAFSSIVNGGKYYKPTVVAGIVDKNNKFVSSEASKPSMSISKATADQVREMTHNARKIFYESLDKRGYYTGGKTGTSQVIKDGEYAEDETVATYLGFGGSEETTRYVIMVQVSGDHMELQGNYHAMPIFTDISNWMLDYLRIQPKG